MSNVYVNGSPIDVDPSNWQVVAKQAIESAIAKNPNLTNATQLAIMNAVKEAGGVFDSASPFHSGGDSVAVSNLETPPIFNSPIIGNISTAVGDWIEHVGTKTEAYQESAKNAFAAVVGGTGDAVNNLTSEVKTALFVVAVLGSLFLVVYAAKALK